MLDSISAKGASFFSGALGGAGLGAVPAGGETLPETGKTDATGADRGITTHLPIMDGVDPWFEEFDPARDQIVVVLPRSMATASIEDIGLVYDEDYDETEVRLTTPAGERTICFLPGVTPDEIHAGHFDFLSEAEARAELAA